MSVLAFHRPSQPRPLPALTERVRLGMMQLGHQGVSEQWLLRFCGDQHWALLAGAMGQDRAVFQDEAGRPIYAAFCATDLRLGPPQPGLLGADAMLHSRLFAVSGSQTGSIHQLVAGGTLLAELSMISTFVGHDATRSNHRILRRLPQHEAALPPAPAALTDLAERSRQRARALRQAPPLNAAPSITPNPALDFNAVGLMYFPAFSRIAAEAEWALHRSMAALARREVTYLGNLNAGEALMVEAAPGRVQIARLDGQVICHALCEHHDGALSSQPSNA